MSSDPLSRAWTAFPDHFEILGRLEIGLSLDQFSKQMTSVMDWSDEELNTRLSMTYYPEALKIISFFGAGATGRIMQYRGKRGYDPKRVREISKSFCPPSDFNGPRSELLKAHNMGEYGSGGLPDTPGMRNDFKTEPMSSALDIEHEARRYTHPEHAKNTRQFLDLIQECRERSVDFSKLAWCRTAISIQMCQTFSTLSPESWADWPLKVAVHAACTLQRAHSGELDSLTAAITMFQMCREIGHVLKGILRNIPASTDTATMISMLIYAGQTFLTAGICQALTSQLNDEQACVVYGLAIVSKFLLNSVAEVVIPSSYEWMGLAARCIKSTNFCPSRDRLSLNMNIHQRDIFHLIARAKYIPTSRKLHSTCGDICVNASSTANHKQAGHLNEGCQCQTKAFIPMETEELVLFDTRTQELRLAEPDDCYVAVSQVWFQGIFGQASRKCGACSLDYLATTCHNIGMRYAWVDTLCMPTDPELRGKVVGQLRNIYLNAAATLVVDAGLISTIARNALDLSLAILLSDWSSRVWTLQEGVLASKLLFCVGKQVLALPQGHYALEMLNGHHRIPAYILMGYGNREFAHHSPDGGRKSWFLDALLELAAGRKTSYECDYLYGLSALLPSTPANRAQGSDQVAVEVAQMYRSGGFDFGMLMASYERCKIVGYRWMPLGARTASIFPHTGILGRIAGENGGLECHAKALIKLTSIVDIYKEVRKIPKELRLRKTADIEMSIAMKPDIKYWYSTEIAGMFVGTVVKAEGLVFCSVYQSDWHADNVLGFVVSPMASQGHVRPAYQYIERAIVFGVIPSTSTPLDIVVT